MDSQAQTIDLGRLLEESLSLPEADRAYLAQSLQDSLPETYDWVAHLRPDVREACAQEIRRRIREIDEGRAVLVDGDEVIPRLSEGMHLGERGQPIGRTSLSNLSIMRADDT